MQRQALCSVPLISNVQAFYIEFAFGKGISGYRGDLDDHVEYVLLGNGQLDGGLHPIVIGFGGEQLIVLQKKDTVLSPSAGAVTVPL